MNLLRTLLAKVIARACVAPLLLLIFSSSAIAIDFTGNATNDFPSSSCIDDPNGQNIALSDSFPDGSISGFDVDQICLLYSSSTDTFFVGIATFDSVETGFPIPFGDADGNGDPGSTSDALLNEGGIDLADLSEEEYFSLIFDLDDDFSSDPEAIAGIGASLEAPEGFRVAEIASPHLGFDFSFLSAYYGDVLTSSLESSLYASPSASKPHLEFTVKGFQEFPGFSDLDLEDPDNSIGFIFKAGSLADTVIGDEDVRLSLLLNDFFDADNDDLPNNFDWDQDNDGIPDVTEQDLENFDSDSNGQFNDEELSRAQLDTDGDSDFDSNDTTFDPTNTDSDDKPDYLDSDTDNDLILDLDEADTKDFDDDNNGLIFPDELILIDINGNYSQGNNSGALQNSELPDTDRDGTPDYRDNDSDGDSLSDASEAGDRDLDTPPIDTDEDGTPNYRDPDSDNDGLPDRSEVDMGTNPLNADSDEDGLSDGVEVGLGEDPLSTSIVTQVQGSGFGGCSFNANSSPNQDRAMMNIFLFVGLLVLPIPLWHCTRKRARKRGLLIIFFFLFYPLFISSNSYAVNAENFRPNFDYQGLVNLLDSRTIEKRSFNFGLGISYSDQPLEFGVLGTGTRVSPLVDYHVNMTLTGAYGISDTITLGLIVPFSPAMRIQPIGSASANTTAAFGDIGLAAKFHLWNFESEKTNMGVAVSPFLTFPSGSTSKYTGDETITGGFKAIYDIDYDKNKFLFNIGLRFREKENLSNLTIGQEMTYGIGYTRPISEQIDLHVLTELTGSTALNDFFSRENTIPLEWTTGFRKGFLDKIINVTLGASLGLTTGYGTPNYRIFSLFGYALPPMKKKEPKAPEVKVESSLVRLERGRIIILEPIHFETAKWIILEESLPVVQAVADLLKAQPHIRHVVVKGHTDWRGSDAYNLDLSRKRANAVVEKLIEYGIEQERLSSEGWGESQPIDTNSTEEGMSKNRRVEFHITEIMTIEEIKTEMEKN